MQKFLCLTVIAYSVAIVIDIERLSLAICTIVSACQKIAFVFNAVFMRFSKYLVANIDLRCDPSCHD